MVVSAQPIPDGNALAGAGVVVARGEALHLLSEVSILPLEAPYAQSRVVVRNDDALDAGFRFHGFAGSRIGDPGPSQRR